MQRVTILVCGEPLRGDDGVGSAIAAALPKTTAHLAEIREVGGLMPDDLAGVGGPVVILDAVDGPPPGEVVDLPLAALAADMAHGPAARSSHVLTLGAALGIAAHLRGLPEGRLIGVAGARYDHGAGLSAPVRRSVPEAAARLNHWVRVLAHGHRAPVCA